MPFLRAGFNARNRDTGIRAMTRGTGYRFKRAELRMFVPAGDYFWYGEGFLTWGQVQFKNLLNFYPGGWHESSRLRDAPVKGAAPPSSGRRGR